MKKEKYNTIPQEDMIWIENSSWFTLPQTIPPNDLIRLFKVKSIILGKQVELPSCGKCVYDAKELVLKRYRLQKAKKNI